MKHEDFRNALVEKLKIQQVQSQFRGAPDLPEHYFKNKRALPFSDAPDPLQCLTCNVMVTRRCSGTAAWALFGAVLCP